MNAAVRWNGSASHQRSAEFRRKALRTPGPYSYERFLAARGLIGIDPAVALTPYVLDWLFAEYRRLDSSDSSGARDNIRIANAGLMRLVQTGDRGVLVALESELKADRPGTSDLLRAMAIAKPLPDHFARTLVIEADAPRGETVATAFELMAKLDDPASLNEWVPAAARALSDPRRQAGAARALKDVAGKTPLGMPELARLAESAAPDATRVIALGALGDASDATRDRSAAVVAAAKPAALQAFRLVLARDPAAHPFEEAARALRFTERDFSRSAAMYLEALKQNPDLTAQAQLLDYIGQAHSAAGVFADELRPYANASDPRVRQAAITALDSIKPSWRESGERAAAVAVGSLPKVAPPQPGAKGADLAKFYGAVRDGDSAAIARLVNARNECAVDLAQRHRSRAHPWGVRCSTAGCRRLRRQRLWRRSPNSSRLAPTRSSVRQEVPRCSTLPKPRVPRKCRKPCSAVRESRGSRWWQIRTFAEPRGRSWNRRSAGRPSVHKAPAGRTSTRSPPQSICASTYRRPRSPTQSKHASWRAATGASRPTVS